MEEIKSYPVTSEKINCVGEVCPILFMLEGNFQGGCKYDDVLVRHLELLSPLFFNLLENGVSILSVTGDPNDSVLCLCRPAENCGYKSADILQMSKGKERISISNNLCLACLVIDTSHWKGQI